LAGYADIGWSNRLGWYEGFCLLTAVDPTGVITGFGFGPASTKDQQMAETFFALRHQPDPRLPSVGSFLAASEPRYYVVDKGFEGKDPHQRWSEHYGARVVCAPKRNSSKPWPKALRRWLAGLRQKIVESVYDKLLNTFGLGRERPHELRGLREHAWRRKWRYTTSACGSTKASDGLGWLSLTYLGGDPISHQTFQYRWIGEVVLGRNEDVAIPLRHLGCPGSCLRRIVTGNR
jgi:hypothetical protein